MEVQDTTYQEVDKEENHSIASEQNSKVLHTIQK